MLVGDTGIGIGNTRRGENISLTHRRSVSKIHQVGVSCQQETPGDVSVGKTGLVSVGNARSRRDVNKRHHANKK